MDLNLTWYILLAILLIGYAILDGFDLGVGIIHPFLRGERERNAAIKAVGPLWDGNEVWLVTFGGALFAAFPEAYATIFSAFYIPFMLLLFCLILRAVSIDFRNKVESKAWKSVWDYGFFISSLIATFLFGVAVGNSIVGLPLSERGVFIGSQLDLLNPYSLSVGVLAIALLALHGVIFLYLKTEGAISEKLNRWIWHTWGLFLVVYLLTTIFTLIEHPQAIANFKHAPWAAVVVIINVLAVANIPRCLFNEKYAAAFVSSCVNIACLIFLFGVALFPNMATASNDPANTLTIYNAAASQSTLWLMFIIAMIGVPLVSAYTVITYWTFRGKIEV